MKMIFGAAAFAALALSSATAFAQNTKRAPENLRTVQIDCMKQQGATFDKTRNAWVIPEAPDYIMSSRIDAAQRCVSQRIGKPAEHFIREEVRHY